MYGFFEVGMQRKDLIIRIAGDGGQGIVTTGRLLDMAIAHAGLNVLTESTFASEITGGEVVYQVRVSPSPIYSQGDRVDILLAMSGKAYQNNKEYLTPGCVMIYDEDLVKPERLEGVILYPISMSSISKSLGSPISKNMVSLGALTKLLCLPEDHLRRLIQKRFSKKNASLLRMNFEAFDEGILYVKAQIGKRDPYQLPVGIKKDSFLLLNGNEAIGLGALISGCRFYSYCPMTPATTIGEWLSRHLSDLNGTVIQTEDATESLALANVMIITMPDYRPKYPKINGEVEINPNHPNLTIWKNKIDVCVFVGVHCHLANIALKIIRAGTNCYTIALCTFSGDDEANITIRDLTAQKIIRLAETVKRVKLSHFDGGSESRPKFTKDSKKV